MRILFDHDTPAPLRHSLSPPHTVITTAEKGWTRLKNGKLLDAAEADGFEMLITCDKGFKHQQNLKHRRIKVLLLSLGNWPSIKLSIPKIVAAIPDAQVGVLNLVECMMSFETFIKEDPSTESETR